MKKTKTTASGPIKFGFLTDTHFSVIRKDFRTDDYFESVLSKFQQCYRHFADEKCRFVLHGGDMFDKYCSYSHKMLLAVRETIMSSPMPTYVIWGQHDLLGYNRESGKSSNLAFLIQICDGKLIEIKDCVEAEGVTIHASHVDQKPAEVLEAIGRSKGPNVAVVHALLYDKASGFETIDVHSLPQTKVCLVLSGDLHCGFGPVQVGDTTYYNPGSLARTSREDRKPKAAVIELSEFLGTWVPEIREFFPVCEKDPFPVQQQETASVSEDIDSTTYLDSFEKVKAESKDIFERLEKTGLETGVDRKVLEYIKSKKSS